MDMSKFRPESHVAQQSRRDKLRVQQSCTHLAEFPNDLDQHQSSGLTPDFVQVRNVRNANLLYDPTLVSSNFIHFPTNSNDAMLLQTAQQNTNRQIQADFLSKVNASSVVSTDTQASDWMVEYAHGLTTASQFLNKPNYNAYQNVQSTVSNPGTEISIQESKRKYADLRFVSPSVYQNTLQDVREAPMGTHGLEPAYYCRNQTSSFDNLENAGVWTHGQQWACDKGSASGNIDCPTKGLSLSLSSNHTTKICSAAQYQNPSETSKGSGKSIQDTAGTPASTCVRSHMGPLGPFTGYATILKNSRFSKPAQELLDKYCHLTSSKLVEICDSSERVSGEVSVSVSGDAANAVAVEVGANKRNNSMASSSSTFYSSKEISIDGGGGSSPGRNESCRSDYQQKKAKLMYLHEEVCRRFKLYHQQMEMVVSSFESVAGLNAATPYISFALKNVTRNFRSLRNAILDQIRQISRVLGDDLLSPTTGISSIKDDINMSKLKYVGQKSSGVNMGFLEPQHHSWRPQRGLPERSVAILRSWLFEHFLHPYPTDTDKHMLATQTGLSRNQVSNWFINARVRVWKPMVEEIHMLESKSFTEGNQNSSRNDGKAISEGGTNEPTEDQYISTSCIEALSDKQLGCSNMHVEEWNHDKHSRMDFHMPTTMEGSFMGFAPYQQSRLEMGGLGAVSLTLGLRHGVESVQQQQQQYQRQEDQLRLQFGGRMIQDFAG